MLAADPCVLVFQGFPSSIFNLLIVILAGLTPVFAACYKELLYVCGRRGQVVSPCCQATRNCYSDAAKLNPVWKWKRVRNSGPSPRRIVSGRDNRNRKDVP